jgi:hypothetical protein
MNRVVFSQMVLFFGAFLLPVASDILVTSAHARETTWQSQQWQWPPRKHLSAPSGIDNR